MRLLLPLFSNANIKDSSGKTPLYLAASKGHIQCVQLLLRCGAQVNIHDSVTRRTPVHVAAAHGHEACLILLLENTEDGSVVDNRDSAQRYLVMFN